MRILVGQFGGPTTVFNASLYGVLAQAHDQGAEVLGVRGGGRGLLAGDFVRLDGPPPRWLLETPGAALGAGRQALDAESLRVVCGNLARAGVAGAVVLGGNGTMGLAAALARAAGIPVAGVPKTIDNDLWGTDHAPGYPSAASCVVHAVRDLATDLRAMLGFEDVRLVEVMGRRAGWLAAAAALARDHADDLPQRILLPELPLDVDELARDIARLHRRDGSVLVVVAEGLADAGGRLLGLQPLDAAGRTAVLGGAARVLAEALRARLPLTIRAESLGFLPRCLGSAATPRDRREAEDLGRHAAGAVLSGRGGVMAALGKRRDPRGGCPLDLVPLEEVAGREYPLPPEMRDLGPAFTQWLTPLVEAPDRRPRWLA